jgi:hypothetical protein
MIRITEHTNIKSIKEVIWFLKYSQAESLEDIEEIAHNDELYYDQLNYAVQMEELIENLSNSQ